MTVAAQITKLLVAAKNWLAGRWREIALASVSIALSYVVLDIGYRLYQYWAIRGTLVAIVDQHKSSAFNTTPKA